VLSGSTADHGPFQRGRAGWEIVGRDHLDRGSARNEAHNEQDPPARAAMPDRALEDPVRSCRTHGETKPFPTRTLMVRNGRTLPGSAPRCLREARTRTCSVVRGEAITTALQLGCPPGREAFRGGTRWGSGQEEDQARRLGSREGEASGTSAGTAKVPGVCGGSGRRYVQAGHAGHAGHASRVGGGRDRATRSPA
jgi:hypothetical protein